MEPANLVVAWQLTVYHHGGVGACIVQFISMGLAKRTHVGQASGMRGFVGYCFGEVYLSAGERCVVVRSYPGKVVDLEVLVQHCEIVRWEEIPQDDHSRLRI